MYKGDYRVFLSFYEEALTLELAHELLGVPSVKEIDYYDADHIMALALSVHEAVARRQNEPTPYWPLIHKLYHYDDIWGEISIQLEEASIWDIEPFDTETFAFFVIECAEDKCRLGIEREDKKYWAEDYSPSIGDMVFEGMFEQDEERACSLEWGVYH